MAGVNLAAWKENGGLGMANGMLRSASVLPGDVFPQVRTDEDGRFEIRGVGCERLVSLLIEEDTIARVRLSVVTCSGFDPQPYARAAALANARFQKDNGDSLDVVPALYPPDFLYVARAARVLEGTVRAADTHEPIAGIVVSAQSGGEYHGQVVTDEHGNFRLPGMTKGKFQGIWIHPKPGSPWLSWYKSMPDPAGAGPIRVDASLTRGVVVSGRVVDKKTGQGVPATVYDMSVLGNRSIAETEGQRPGFFQTTTQCDHDGRFQLTAVPGLSAVTVETDSVGPMLNGAHVNPYRGAVPDPADRSKPYLQSFNNTFMLMPAQGTNGPLLNQFAGYKVVDLPEVGGTAHVDITVDPGTTATVHIEDPEGKPLPETCVAGITFGEWPWGYRLTNSTCAVCALEPGKPRAVFFYHEARKLAGSLVIHGDDSKPRTVRLQPTGAVCGRIVDSRGKPVPGLEVWLTASHPTLQTLHQIIRGGLRKVTTGPDGRFRLDGIVPDWYFGFGLVLNGNRFPIQGRIGFRRVESGETLDIGEVRGKEAVP